MDAKPAWNRVRVSRGESCANTDVPQLALACVLACCSWTALFGRRRRRDRVAGRSLKRRHGSGPCLSSRPLVASWVPSPSPMNSPGPGSPSFEDMDHIVAAKLESAGVRSVPLRFDRHPTSKHQDLMRSSSRHGQGGGATAFCSVPASIHHDCSGGPHQGKAWGTP